MGFRACGLCVCGFVAAQILAVFGVFLISRNGRAASVWDFVTSASTFPRVLRAKRSYQKKLGGRFKRPPPAALKIRPSDVLVITPPRCGATWVSHMAHQLHVQGRPVDFQSQDDVVPWVESLDTDFLNGTALNGNPNDEQLKSPRVFKSHLGFRYLPSGEYKKVFVFRDPGDALVSAAKLLPSFWGIVDPPSILQLCSFFLFSGDAEGMLASLIKAWQIRDNDDVLLLFYEDIQEDREAALRRLAAFMGVHADESLIALVLEQTSHAVMSEQHLAFPNLAQARHIHRAQGLELDEDSMLRKQERGDGKVGDSFTLPPSFVQALERSWWRHVFPHLGFLNYSALRAARALELHDLRHSRQLPPVVDIGGLLTDTKGSRWHDAAEALATAAITWGAARITGHGVDVARMHDLASRYFSLPEQLRGGSVRNATAGFQRGSLPAHGEGVAQQSLEVKEGFVYGYEWPSEADAAGPSNPLEGHNVWPGDHEQLGQGWRERLQVYYNESVAIAKAVLEGVDVLGRSDVCEGNRTAAATMTEICDGGEKISKMRMFNYFPETYRPDVLQGKPRVGSSLDTDSYLLTVILRDGKSRLQIATNSSQANNSEMSWLDLPSGRSDELILVFGDYLSLYMGGRTMSPAHRVLHPENGTSISFVFSFSPAYSARLPRPAAADPRQAEHDRERVNSWLDQVDPMIWDRPFGEYAQRKRSHDMSNQR